MKRSISFILLFLLLAGVAGIGANGQQEDGQVPYGPPWSSQDFTSGDKITVTGAIYFRNRMHPELKGGEQEYELLVPHRYYYGIDLEEGQTITVEGYPVAGMPCWGEAEHDEAHLWVTKAVIEGQEYDLSQGLPYGRGPMMMGRGPMSRGRGRW